MLRRFAINVAVAGCLAAACDSGWAQSWADSVITEREHDFKVLARGANAEHRFTIRNDVADEIHIAAVSSSCGCTQPTVGKRSLKRGESTELIAKFNTIGFKGHHKATVTVTFDRPSYAEVRLFVKGNVRSDVVFKPGQVELGTVDSGDAVEKSVFVEYAGRRDWKIVDIEGDTSRFEVEIKSHNQNGNRTSYELVVRLKETADDGYINDRLTLVTNDRNDRTIPLNIRGVIQAALTVSPKSLQLGSVKPGEQVTKQLIVRGKTPFKIAGIACDDKCFEFKKPDAAKKLHRIPVTFTAGEESGKFVEKIRIEVEGKSQSLPEVVAHFEVIDE